MIVYLYCIYIYIHIHIYYVYTYTSTYAHTGTYCISGVYDQDVHIIPMVCRSSRYMDEPSDRSTGEVEQEEEADEQETSREMQAAWVPAMAISHPGAIEQGHV